MGNAMIETVALSKTYRSGRREVHALKDLSLSIQEGEVFGFLGPNGAGKTTTIRLLLDFIRPSSGKATLLGMDSRRDSVAIHRQVGYLPGEFSVWRHMTAQQALDYLAALRGLKDRHYMHQLTERLQFDPSRRVRDFSTGNKRKLGLIQAMMHKPPLLILDEPTSGLDPLMQQTFNDILRETRHEGRTVFLSSHVLNEVQAVCDRVGILRNGKLETVDRVDTLTHVDFRYVRMTLRQELSSTALGQLGQLAGISDVTALGKTVRLRLQGDFDPLLRALADHYVEDLHIQEPTLEEIFLAYYGNHQNGRAI